MNTTDLLLSDIVKKISELLKLADKHILAGNFDEAIANVMKVFDFDPKNIYAKAYLKRIEVFRKQKEKKRNERTPPSTVIQGSCRSKGLEEEITETEWPESPVEYVESDKNKRDKNHTDEQDEKSKSVYLRIEPLVKDSSSRKNLSPEEERKFIEEIISKEAENLPEATNHPSANAVSTKNLSEDEKKEKLYLEKVDVAWSGGRISEYDEENLNKLRGELGISPERHKELERRVKLSLYVKAVKKAWEERAITPTGAQILEDLREQYNITLEEHLKIEYHILYELHGLKSKGIVMIIDDDNELVRVIKSILQDEEYATLNLSLGIKVGTF